MPKLPDAEKPTRAFNRNTLVKKVIFTLLVFIFFATPSLAFAGYYNVCGTLRYWDSRTQRAYGSKVAPISGTNWNRPARRVLLYLFDQDGACNDHHPFNCSENDDDFLQSAYSDPTTGAFCFFGIGDLEDIYILTKYESDDTQVLNDDDAHPVTFSDTVWNFGSGGNLTKNWNITCTNDSRNNVQGLCDGEVDVATWFMLSEGYANILDSAVQVDWLISPDTLFHPNGHNEKISYHYPDNASGLCASNFADGGAYNCNDICISFSGAARPHTVAHEAGHVLQKRMLNVCEPYSYCGIFHSWNSNEHDSCSTSEGWAGFFAAATYWDKSASNAWVYSPGINLEGLTINGNPSPGPFVDLRPCVKQSVAPHSVEGNVARWFWDLYDDTMVDDCQSFGYPNYVCDNLTLPFNTLLRTWDHFPSGTSNRQNRETSISDPNGVNVWDYNYHLNVNYLNTYSNSEVYLNCLEYQDYN